MLKTQNLIIQTILWILYVCFPIFVLPEPSQILLNDNVVLLGYLISSFISIFFFYYNYYWAIPNLYFTKKYILFAVSVLSFLVSAVVIIKFASYVYISNNELHFVDNPRFSGSFILRFTLIFIISSSLRFFKKMKEIETERAKTELSFLKAQINPHFLFNTLNGIYAMAITKSEQTADSILKLSSIMRHVILDSNSETVSLEKELQYIRDYVELQKIRLTDKTIVDLKIEGETIGKNIEPLLLISFIENAFKYGISTEKRTNIEINIKIENKNLRLFVKNDIISKSKENSENKSEIGLKNTIKRLNLIYQNQYSLDTQNSNNQYIVSLTIPF